MPVPQTDLSCGVGVTMMATCGSKHRATGGSQRLGQWPRKVSLDRGPAGGIFQACHPARLNALSRFSPALPPPALPRLCPSQTLSSILPLTTAAPCLGSPSCLPLSQGPLCSC